MSGTVTLQVWHLQHWRETDPYDKAAVNRVWCEQRSDRFKLVAHVQVDAAKDVGQQLEDAWQATNTIMQPWWRNPDVTPMFQDWYCRSTSAGDVIVASDGIAHRVASLGFDLVEG